MLRPWGAVLGSGLEVPRIISRYSFFITSEVGTGLLLGGGLSFLSSAEGYASDNYVSLDVVLVDGTLVTATADNEYQDLFKALKGGANRFGIVTRYEVKAVHTGTKEEKRWWGGLFVVSDLLIFLPIRVLIFS